MLTTHDKSARKTVLVILNMQPRCLQSLGDDQAEVLAAVLHRIGRARDANQHILRVEYGTEQDSHPHILDRLDGYPLALHAHKFQVDGSAEIEQAIAHLDAKLIRICGLFATGAVLSTVLGLAKRLPNTAIEVLPSACGFRESDYEEFQTLMPTNARIDFRSDAQEEEILRLCRESLDANRLRAAAEDGAARKRNASPGMPVLTQSQAAQAGKRFEQAWADFEEQRAKSGRAASPHDYFVHQALFAATHGAHAVQVVPDGEQSDHQ